MPDLPYYKLKKDVKYYLQSSLDNFGSGKRFFMWSGTKIDNYLNMALRVQEPHLKKDNFSQDENLHFDYYSIKRFSHQLNEACNKLWGSIELAYAVKSNRLCQKFTYEFSGGSLIPNLYYSVLSAMVSSMCGFGIISFRHISEQKDYFLIRTAGGWQLFPRKDYIISISKKPVKGWHEESIKTYETLIELGYELPNIDFNELSELRKLRNKFHYYILGKTSMEEFFGIDEFFEHLPFVLNVIKDGFDLLCYLHKDLRKIDERFKDINENIYKLFDLYGKDKSKLPFFVNIPKNDIVI